MAQPRPARLTTAARPAHLARQHPRALGRVRHGYEAVMPIASTCRRCYDITPAGVGRARSARRAGRLRPRRLRREHLRHGARSGRHRPAGHRRDDGRSLVPGHVRRRPARRADAGRAPVSLDAHDADGAAALVDRGAGSEPRRDRHRPAPRRAARRRRRSAHDRVERSGRTRTCGSPMSPTSPATSMLQTQSLRHDGDRRSPTAS